MTIGDIEKLQSVLANWDEIATRKQAFVEKNSPDGDEPICGYQEWDETLTDFNYDLADAGEFLADAIREVIG
ncbi:hypothetical protein SEA_CHARGERPOWER_78 [Mycobacterium phage Chargerpower]|nr:hypothetical protein SEA_CHARGERPOWER_78 [Mycobacterium phage Chargerpower]